MVLAVSHRVAEVDEVVLAVSHRVAEADEVVLTVSYLQRERGQGRQLDESRQIAHAPAETSSEC